MAKYNVYGLGNALVDMEFEVEVDLLRELKIDKGVMTLMDEQQQSNILAQLENFSCKKSCGGSAANTMVAISQLGGRTFYSCKVANDEIGSFYLQDLLNCGVDTNLPNGDRSEGITGKCLVMVTPDADRTMGTFLGITGSLSSQELAPEAIAAAEYLYLEGYLVSSPGGVAKEAAIEAKSIAENHGVKTALSLSDANMTEFFREGLLEIIGSGLDLIFSNEIEALKMAQTEDLNQAIAQMKTLAKGFAITRGAHGSLIFDGEQLHEIKPVKVQAVDTVGAGDMYAGAFLYGITHGMSYVDAGNLASKAAALVVSSFGPRLTTNELKCLLSP
ncbi:adenosine kinase [Gloeocapsa sp. PCC 73106]|uniref:adenosine kinase n=1 Tax=Gloeocapsa sp. PCC 73106 TaxID=102232 RepID=UPI0002ACE6DF|nr:adenosine kinase [Gloeocapsa sp. PCC 73106]ELR96899.1 sugar kinase, ribokinase [Gloeocapsa sp. PCC 73106]